MERLCLKCYINKYKDNIGGSVLQISSEKYVCDNCLKEEYIIISKGKNFLIFEEKPTLFLE